MFDRRQITDHATQKRAAIGKIALAKKINKNYLSCILPSAFSFFFSAHCDHASIWFRYGDIAV